MSADPVTYERRGPAAVVTIDRQARRNAVDGPTAELLGEAYERFEADDDARVMILTGAGGVAFCAGADLKAIDTFGPRLFKDEGPLGFTRRIASKPTIAAIGGWCLAGGMELALWCDLRIAAEGSTLGFTERRFGVPLIDGGTQRLPRLVGLGRALDIILTGREFDTAEAERMGFVNRVVAPGGALAAAVELAEQLASFPWTGLVNDRLSVYAGLGLGLQAALAEEDRLGRETIFSAGFADGVSQFESRPRSVPGT
jgi:enoyl-CoA hydratase